MLKQHLRPNTSRISAFPNQFYLQVIISRASTGFIAVDKGRLVDVVNYQVEIAVVVQIGIGGPVGKTFLIEPPSSSLVGKSKVAVVLVGIVGIFRLNGMACYPTSTNSSSSELICSVSSGFSVKSSAFTFSATCFGSRAPTSAATTAGWWMVQLMAN